MKKIILLAITVIFVVMSFSFIVLADEMTPKSVAAVSYTHLTLPTNREV